MHPRHILDRYQIQPKKSLGQNFIVEESIINRIVEAAELDCHDSVLEIGPGLGALTSVMASQAEKIVAVELDDRLIPVLTGILSGYDNVQLIHGDILNMDIGALCPKPYKVVANLPYYITGAVLRHLVEQKKALDRPESMVLTVQLEVAEKLVAKPGQMSLLSVGVQFFGTVNQVLRIKAGAFYPRPDVDSAVVRIDARPKPVVPIQDEQFFFNVVRAGFSQKRKQLRNSLRAGLSLPVEKVESALSISEIDHHRRAETLAVEEWVKLAFAFKQI